MCGCLPHYLVSVPRVLVLPPPFLVLREIALSGYGVHLLACSGIGCTSCKILGTMPGTVEGCTKMSQLQGDTVLKVFGSSQGGSPRRLSPEAKRRRSS